MKEYIFTTQIAPCREWFFPGRKPSNDLKNFFEATDRYTDSVQSPLLKFTVPVIFRLKYACGMRPQEVRLLRCEDFNFDDDTIYIAEGKHNKDRCLPVSSEIMGMCKKYNFISEAIVPNRMFFFQAPSGNAYTKEWLGRAFRLCWKMSGNDVSRGSCTPYSLRYHNLNKIQTF